MTTTHKPPLTKARRAWLASLKEGDEVALVVGNGTVDWVARAVIRQRRVEHLWLAGGYTVSVKNGVDLFRRQVLCYIAPTAQFAPILELNDQRVAIAAALPLLTPEQVRAIHAIVIEKE
jgi:hypothetical protein